MQLKLNFFQKNNKTSDPNEIKKMGLAELVWVGFNYTCGIAFPLALVTLVNGPNGVGLHMLWIIVLGAVFAGGAAWAFARCSKVYSEGNGGAYIYVRSNFGRFAGWFIGFLQYWALPVTVTSMILTMVTVNLNQLLPTDWAGTPALGDLYLNLIGIGLYVLVSLLIYFGISGFRWFVSLSGVVKWVSTTLMICCAIYLTFTNGAVNFQTAINDTNKISFNFGNFNGAFTAFFYFYLGFETYAVVSKNVRNPHKTISKSIAWILFLAIAFYLIVTILMFGAMGSFNAEGKGGVPTTNPDNWIMDKTLGTAGVIILVICMLSLKLNASMQNALYSGGMLEPLAIEGYISPSLATLSKDNIAIRASIVNLIITVICTVLFLILPFAFGSTISYADILNFSSIITITVYLFVLAATFKLAYQNILKVKWWELLWWGITTLFLLMQVGYFFYALIKGIIDSINLGINTTEGEALFVINFLQLVLVAFIILTAIIWYYLYYVPKLKKRLLETPELQAKLDHTFKHLVVDLQPDNIMDAVKLQQLENINK